MSKTRCAIYTRKSSEEGLEQSFNSLDAQREACEAYILSQKSEGWTALRTTYDDGGFSGGSMERPGLKRLMADIALGKIDVVVVYKVDRLTRSLADFGRIIEVLDKSGASFVSITQAFNTTTSMGRLTLNVLLSFAQFEREVTGERIRDKIAASKAKGMWMGGNLPLGYDTKDRALVINEGEADVVRKIFERYLALGSVLALKQELNDAGVRAKVRVTPEGKARGGGVMSRGALFHMLRNRVYVGDIPHKDKHYPGAHAGIVDQEIFDAVQARLDLGVTDRKARKAAPRSPLAGRLFNDAGHALTPSHSRGQAGGRYRYYISVALAESREAASERAGSIRRVPAPAIEELVLNRVRALSGIPTAGWGDVLPILRRVEIHPEAVILLIATPEHGMWAERRPASDLCQAQGDGLLKLTVHARVRTRGGKTSITTATGSSAVDREGPDRTLVAALRRAHAELRRHGINPGRADDDSRDAKGMNDPNVRRLAGLAFLAPDLQRAILDGRQPRDLRLEHLLAPSLPLSWAAQRERLHFGR